jgi:signal peptidase I
MSRQIPEPNGDGLVGITARPLVPVRSPWKKPTITLLLSLILPGLGQLLNGEPWKGFFFAASLPILTIAALRGRIVFSFLGLVIFFFFFNVWRIWICADAFRVARRGTQPERAFSLTPLTFIVFGSLIIACGLGPSSNYFLQKFGYFRAFRVPSGSFCPAICEGERVVTDMGAYVKFPPKRGDVIMFEYHSAKGPLFIKRVIGVEGDVVSGTDGAILLNGRPFDGHSRPPICGQPAEGHRSGEEPRFGPVKVPASSFFVVGDNSTNSYDSRIPGFGLVTLDQVRGRPVYIYWSTGKSRIGCAVN